jgi:hypothetical protein
MKTVVLMVIILFALTSGLSGMNKVHADEQFIQDEPMEEDVIIPEEFIQDEPMEEEMMLPEEEMNNDEVWAEEREEFALDEEQQAFENENQEYEEIEEGRGYLGIDDIDRL